MKEDKLDFNNLETVSESAIRKNQHQLHLHDIFNKKNCKIMNIIFYYIFAPFPSNTSEH